MNFFEDDPFKSQKNQDASNDSAESFENKADEIKRLPQNVAHLCQFGIRVGSIKKAIARAEKLGMSIPDVMIADGFVTETTFYRSLARSLGMRFSLRRRKVLAYTECHETIRSGIAPLAYPVGGFCFMVAPSGSGISAFIREFGQRQNLSSTNLVLTTPSNFSECVRHATNKQTIEYTTSRLERINPTLCAASLPALGFVVVFLAILLTTIAVSFLEPTFWHLVLIALTIYPVVPSMIMKIWVLAMTFRTPPPKPRPLNDYELPVYTILVPLFNEATIVPQLVKALKALDYPPAKLDVKMLLEENDVATIAAVKAEAVQSIFDIIICPEGKPQTKPRALDMGLYFAKGDYVVVYDAEDVPDPGQLRLAAAYFAEGGSKLGCLQAKLVIDNVSDSWITRMFTLEYARLFDVMIPGMARADLPIPLGGTSNHFRREVLERTIGWDPWNVTEDADLGLRLARFGYIVSDLPSVTLEEAPTNLGSWFNQRIRWMKGWMQTALVHCRHPLRLIDEVGAWKGFLLILVATNALVSSLLHPLLLIFMSLVFNALEAHDTGSIETISMMFGLVLYNSVIGIMMLTEGSRRRRVPMRWNDIPLFFIYTTLITAASWAALKELVVAPSFWRKTEHGLTKTPRAKTAPTDQK